MRPFLRLFLAAMYGPSELSISWPSRQGPTAAQEQQIAHTLVTDRDRAGRTRDIPSWRLEQICAAGASVGLSAPATVSLRKRIIAAAWPQLFFASQKYRDENGEKEHATRVEALLLEYLQSLGITCITEADQLAAAAVHSAAGQVLLGSSTGAGAMPSTVGGTPDVLFQPPIRINGQLVYWMECKCWYASSSVVGKKRQFSLDGMCKQVNKYCAKFGPGAVFFLHGFSCELLARLRQAGLLSSDTEVIFVDGAPLNPAKIAALYDGIDG